MADWLARIEAIAQGRAVWNSMADASPWDGFYRDYDNASAEDRRAAEHAARFPDA